MTYGYTDVMTIDCTIKIVYNLNATTVNNNVYCWILYDKLEKLKF